MSRQDAKERQGMAPAERSFSDFITHLAFFGVTLLER
jgi:hypothetical protein